LIRKSQKRKKSLKKKTLNKKTVDTTVDIKQPEVDITAIRNEYEAQLTQKDIDIRQLKATISSVRKIIGVENEKLTSSLTGINTGQIEMWVEKLGRNVGTAKILEFLTEKYPMKFTRPQIALAVGIKYKGSTFRAYMATLKRNSLIIEESGEVWVNPDLLK